MSHALQLKGAGKEVTRARIDVPRVPLLLPPGYEDTGQTVDKASRLLNVFTVTKRGITRRQLQS